MLKPREAVRRLANDPLRHTVGVLVMALMLALPGVAWVRCGLGCHVAGGSDNTGCLNFVGQDISEEDISALADEMVDRIDVLAVEIVGRDQGLQALSQLAGLGDLVVP